jgi:hypothetical protein
MYQSWPSSGLVHHSIGFCFGRKLFCKPGFPAETTSILVPPVRGLQAAPAKIIWRDGAPDDFQQQRDENGLLAALIIMAKRKFDGVAQFRVGPSGRPNRSWRNGGTRSAGGGQASLYFNESAAFSPAAKPLWA